LQNARLVITDSGGLQKESYFFRKPCVILRAETEWTEIVQTGNAVCADADEGMILQHSSAFFNRMNADFPSLYGDGAAAGKIIQTLLAHFPL
jgi:UDP-GlcNAc3NAcA epimerase